MGYQKREARPGDPMTLLLTTTGWDGVGQDREDCKSHWLVILRRSLLILKEAHEHDTISGFDERRGDCAL